MDYLCAGRTILAIGPKDIASMEYLRNNEVALCANSEEDIDSIISNLKDSPEIINSMSNKGLDFLRKNMDVKLLQKEFMKDLRNVVRNGCSAFCEK